MSADTIDQLAFRLEDCQIDVAMNTDVKEQRPWRLYEIRRQEDMGGSSMRAVTVTHLPTGISFTEERFLPKRNREIAVEAVKRRVEEFIAAAKASVQKDARDD